MALDRPATGSLLPDDHLVGVLLFDPVLGDLVEPSLLDGTSIRVEVRRDSLIRIGSSGDVEYHTLSPNRAEQLFRAVEASHLPDRMELLEAE